MVAAAEEDLRSVFFVGANSGPERIYLNQARMAPVINSQ